MIVTLITLELVSIIIAGAIVATKEVYLVLLSLQWN
jgi:hypothetical protein